MSIFDITLVDIDKSEASRLVSSIMDIFVKTFCDLRIICFLFTFFYLECRKNPFFTFYYDLEKIIFCLTFRDLERICFLLFATFKESVLLFETLRESDFTFCDLERICFLLLATFKESVFTLRP